ncbi:amino acid (glutamine) ABC transporter ATP binding protein [Legionella birminghamensis]|uniref:Amino acid (Glutamine) ABC transporter ATP binding protein n=1 Tax=Legionella birminghamensis TaxID=28083 RepID=A0A378I9F7_9GAMM|nr:ATP-binding cassette domain-containing protein [Legionella birminghamensis]KTC75201.1 amino acid (glutamine) ABC transporter ATP binding protein [Legionella birminghamensis]STX31848.1 polar amino acid transport system ATP-binding protein [Legionella birminghamensis]
MLHIHKLKKSFGSLQVFNDLSFSVKPNTIVGLAGASGSGKSTLLRCIQQLENPDSGAITVHGKTGFMFQDFQLFPHMTVLDNLIYAPRLHYPSDNHTAKAKELLESLSLSEKMNMYPSRLSGGQQQRVALARTLMMQPDLLLCDEPTSGLDVVNTSEVSELLNIVRQLKVSMLIASHDLDFLTGIADRIILLKAGELLADIQPATIKNPVLFLKQFY